MIVPRRTMLLVVLALVACACQSGLQGPGVQAAAGEAAAAPAAENVAPPDFGMDRPVSVIVVTHGQASDPFWSVVSNGVQQAARDFDVDVQYQAPTTFDMVQMSQLVEAAIAQDPDGLVVSIPDADALSGPIQRAIQAGIPVVSINAGEEVALDLGVLTHIGQSEREAGYGGGLRLAEAGVRNALCINHEQGNVSLELRCAGFQQAIEEAGGTVRQLAVDGSDPTDAQQRVEAALSQDPQIDGGLAVGPLGMGPTLAALRDTGRLADTTWGSFDLGPEILQAVADGELAFAIDQQQYLQGYLGVQAVTQNARIGVHPVGVVATGPAFVTQGQAAQVIELTQQGIR